MGEDRMCLYAIVNINKRNRFALISKCELPSPVAGFKAFKAVLADVTCANVVLLNEKGGLY